ncbi:acyl-CoA dehydrogenase family protein [Paenibacillus sp. GCM10027626]|uniref:acyl-CoA dehydrogenase family protein n=1 Tax=Paenibacillus sp. GCM10027626 TaxID=3273411 RepID=UPI00363B30D4
MAKRRSIDQYIRNGKEEKLAARAEQLAGIFAGRAARYDAEGSFPFENFADLREAGFYKLTVPKRYGGDEISLYELVIVQERLAAGDGSTTLGFGWHLGQTLHYRSTGSWPEPLFRRFCQDVVERGAMINSFASERATGSPSRGGKPETTAIKTDAGWLISGRKIFSTLSPILTQFIVSAWVQDEQRLGHFLVGKSDRVRIEETWNTLGMRATGSHDLILDQAFVPEDSRIDQLDALGHPLPHADDASGWLLHIPACYIGIAHAARDFAVEFARTYRPNSLPGPIAELPHIQLQIGQMEAELRTARNMLYTAADRWDKETGNWADLKPELGLAKYVATNNAIQIVDKAMRIVGGTSLSRTLPLERMYRDVRAGLHNPPMDDTVLRSLAQEALQEPHSKSES